MKRKYKNLILSVIMVVTIILTFPGCFSASRESVLMKEYGIDISITELKIRINEFGYRFAGIVELSADEIISKTTNAEIKKHALLWKINAIPAMIRSLNINDPMASGVDAWILSAQILQYFEDGFGKDLFGEYQDIAITASNYIVNDFEKLAKDLKGTDDISKGQKIVMEWVKENPIKNNKFLRVSSLDEVAKIIGSVNYDLGTTVGNIAVSVDELKNQVTFYTNFLPKQIKWQAQYELINFLGDSLIEKSVNNIDRVILSTERISKMIEESPELVREIHLSTMVEIDKQRLETLEIISQERIAILEAVTRERIAILNDVNRERIETLDRIEKMTENMLIRSSVFASDIIDSLFWRVLILFGIGFIGGLILIIIYKKH